jgi:hypothetical protein
MEVGRGEWWDRVECNLCKEGRGKREKGRERREEGNNEISIEL